MTKVFIGGEEVDFIAVVNLMDEALRKQVHATFVCRGDDWDEQRFVEAYCERHSSKYGAEFVATRPVLIH